VVTSTCFVLLQLNLPSICAKKEEDKQCIFDHHCLNFEFLFVIVCVEYSFNLMDQVNIGLHDCWSLVQTNFEKEVQHFKTTNYHYPPKGHTAIVYLHFSIFETN
jgi:hypothetical protein